MSDSALANIFCRFFELVWANGEEIEAAQRVRYEVYCREFGFEKEEDCPGGLETDTYDSQSIHCIVRHRASGQVAGCVRVVHTLSDDAVAELPIERYCGHGLEHPRLHPARLPREQICEISRLAIPMAFRRRVGEARSPVGDVNTLLFEPEEYRTYPLLATALFFAADSVVALTGLKHVFAMMQPPLARRLARQGIHFHQIGPVIDYHGPRAPYYVHADYALCAIESSLRPLQNAVHDALERQHATLEAHLPAATGPSHDPTLRLPTGLHAHLGMGDGAGVGEATPDHGGDRRPGRRRRQSSVDPDPSRDRALPVG